MKNVIITGANRGIGLSMVKAYAKNGDNVWACAKKENIEFEKQMREIAETYQVEIKPVYFDLSNPDEIKRGIKTILLEKKSVDVLINNAGVAHGGLFTMTTIDRIKEIYEVNVFAQLQITQAIARYMMKQKRGCIINMCSVGGIEAESGYIAYGSSKAAMIWITKCLSKELGPYNIRVNGIAPGLVDTDMGNYKSDDEKRKVIERSSLHRIGRPEEIANAALYISSEEAAYMTGHILVLDGGRL